MRREQVRRRRRPARPPRARARPPRDSRARAPSVVGYWSSTPNSLRTERRRVSASPTIVVDPARPRARLHDVDRLRMAARVDEEGRLPFLPARLVRHEHRLGRRRSLVEQRRVRDLEPGEIDHHRLEVQQRLQPPLRDLRLIRRVRRVPAGILEDVPLDDRRRERVVVAVAEVRAEDPVLPRDGAHRGQRLVLAPAARGWRAAGGGGSPRGSSRRSARRASRSRAAPSISATSASLGPTWRGMKLSAGADRGASRRWSSCKPQAPARRRYVVRMSGVAHPAMFRRRREGSRDPFIIAAERLPWRLLLSPAARWSRKHGARRGADGARPADGRARSSASTAGRRPRSPSAGTSARAASIAPTSSSAAASASCDVRPVGGRCSTIARSPTASRRPAPPTGPLRRRVRADQRCSSAAPSTRSAFASPSAAPASRERAAERRRPASPSRRAVS